jgi:hypothetical protein
VTARDAANLVVWQALAACLESVDFTPFGSLPGVTVARYWAASVPCHGDGGVLGGGFSCFLRQFLCGDLCLGQEALVKEFRSVSEGPEFGLGGGEGGGG